MSCFDFKQFRISHTHSFKVGTDAVLLGAWAEIPQTGAILDVGCGSGIVTLMLAQRTQALITGIDIQPESIVEARENALASPFAERITLMCQDLLTYTPPTPFDCIVSNPPYYEEDTPSPVAETNTAKHTMGSLTFEDLAGHATRLLKDDGLFQVILPSQAYTRFADIAQRHHLYLIHATSVQTTEKKAAKRHLLCFRKSAGHTPHPIFDSICLQTNGGERSRAYRELTKDFYLW